MFDLKVIRNSLVLIFISLLIALLWSLRASSARLAVWVDQLGWLGLLFFIIGGFIFIAIRGVFDLVIFAWKALFGSSSLKKLEPYMPRHNQESLPEQEEKEKAFDIHVSGAQERHKQNERLAITLMFAGAVNYIISLITALIFMR